MVIAFLIAKHFAVETDRTLEEIKKRGFKSRGEKNGDFALFSNEENSFFKPYEVQVAENHEEDKRL